MSGSGVRRNRSDIVASIVIVGAMMSIAPGCGTTYQPRPSARLSVVIHHGAAMYVGNGRETPVGPLGGTLQELVAATPAAAEHARTAHTQLAIGIPCYLGGITGVVVGVAVLSGPVGWVILGVGAAVGGTGLGLMGAGFTHALDAANIHNDAVTQPPLDAPIGAK